jgi:23S rRNA pseudouridine1911/1915/1917 synthase
VTNKSEKILSTPSNLQVLYEDNHLIIVNKRPGDIVQGDKTGDTPLSEVVKSYLKNKYHKPGNVYLGVVHRLDRPTSGIVVFAKTSKALARLNKMFAEKSAEKIYWTIVQNAPPKQHDTLKHWLRKNEKNNKSYVFNEEVANSKRAVLHYKLMQRLENYFLLEVRLETGRHHQIRAQLSHINCIIKGDLKYGFKRSNPDGSIHLHAAKLSFTHPVSKEFIEVNAEPPQDDAIWKSIQV